MTHIAQEKLRKNLRKAGRETTKRDIADGSSSSSSSAHAILLAWRLATTNLSRTDLVFAPSPSSSALRMSGCTRTRSRLDTAAAAPPTAAAVAPSIRILPQGSRHCAR